MKPRRTHNPTVSGSNPLPATNRPSRSRRTCAGLGPACGGSRRRCRDLHSIISSTRVGFASATATTRSAFSSVRRVPRRGSPGWTRLSSPQLSRWPQLPRWIVLVECCVPLDLLPCRVVVGEVLYVTARAGLRGQSNSRQTSQPRQASRRVWFAPARHSRRQTPRNRGSLRVPMASVT